MRFRIFFSVLLFAFVPAYADIDKAITPQLSYDTREFTTAGVIIYAADHHVGWNLWGFTDLFSDFDARGRSVFDLTNSFSRYQLSQRVWKSDAWQFGAQVRVDDSAPLTNDSRIKIGPYARYALPVFDAWIQAHVLTYADRGGDVQVSIVWRTQFCSRFVIDGFADLNIEGGRSLWVIEPRAVFPVFGPLNLWIEPRYNDYLRGAKLRHRGIGFGIEAAF